MLLEANQRILFTGDSITDTGRDRENPKDLGHGYAFIVGNLLQGQYP